MNSSQNFPALSFHLSMLSRVKVQFCLKMNICSYVSWAFFSSELSLLFSPHQYVFQVRKEDLGKTVCVWRESHNSMLLTKDCVFHKKPQIYFMLPSVYKMYHCIYILTKDRLLTQSKADFSQKAVSKQQINKLCLSNKVFSMTEYFTRTKVNLKRMLYSNAL